MEGEEKGKKKRHRKREQEKGEHNKIDKTTFNETGRGNVTC